MRSLSVIGIAVLALATCVRPSFADNQMKQSPLLMRRAGPSCQPGNLGGEPGAGYLYRLGPCAGPYTPETPGRRAVGRGRR